MKKLIITLLLLVSALGYSQPRYYVCLAPNVAFDSPANDFNNLMGVNLEVGKYINTTALGITTGYYSLDSKYLFSELIATVPIVTDSGFSISAGIGWFYFKKDITMEYDINYVFDIKDSLSLIITYNNQSAFGTTTSAFCIGLNKDF
jgi:hypothetical protein